MLNKIIKVKKWTYINNTFIKPLEEIREMLLKNIFTPDDSEYQLIVIKMNNVSDNINEVLFKIEKQLLDTTDTYELEDFFSKNSLGLDITKNLFVKEQSRSRDSRDLINFFNYLTENVNTYLNTYLKLNT